jgi:hypothetical protein
MGLTGFATSKTFWIKFGWGVLGGLLTAFGVLFYTYVMNLGLKFLWPDPPGPEPFSGSWRVAIIMTIAGFLVFLLHRFTKAKGVGVGVIIADGRVDNRFVPGALLISLVSLIGGFSLGPVLPTGMVAVTTGILPIPIAFGVYTILIVGLPIIEAIPIFVAGLTALFVMGGFGLYTKEPPPETIAQDAGAFH